ncbi:carboxypeptidase-like regulatory domain-containing protein [Pontimicrobium sp. MEBiC06410]
MKTKFSGILTLFLAFVVQLTFAQEKSISGTISDENGLPMPGVSVLVVGTSNGTQTDFDGNYSLSASTGDVIQYSSIGYKTVDKTVGASNNISFGMEVDVTAIDEVVITALGIKRKKERSSNFCLSRSENRRIS